MNHNCFENYFQKFLVELQGKEEGTGSNNNYNHNRKYIQPKIITQIMVRVRTYGYGWELYDRRELELCSTHVFVVKC